MKSYLKIGVLSASVLFLSWPVLAEDQKPASAAYVWKNVQIVGGGFVCGLVFHPTAKGIYYARTDMGGAYRRSEASGRWEPILDWVSYEDTNLMGVESIAVDPSDPDRVYLACGTYTNPTTPNGAILRSSDRGSTFERTDMPLKMGGNEDGRGNGERLAVDPYDGRIVYFGSRHDGLWKSSDRGVTFNRVETFPDVTEPAPPSENPEGQRRFRRPRSSGIIFVVFDPRSGSVGKACSTIYIGASLMERDNLYRSTDGGQIWQPVPGQPTQYRPTHAVLSPDGMLYLTYGSAPGPSRMSDGGVWKLNTHTDQWTEITPDKPGGERQFGYAAVSVDAAHPQTLIVSSYCRFESGEEIFRSTDGGKTWKPLLKNATFDYSKAPYVQSSVIHWMFDIEIDPANPDHALFTTGYGGYETFNLTEADRDKPVHWSIMATGIEETVALELLSPPRGAPLITAVGDYGCFVYWDLDNPAPEGSCDNPRFGTSNGVTCAELKPEMIVRVGNEAGNHGNNIGYSLDEGKTWQPTEIPAADSRAGHIAVSSDGGTWIWMPQRSGAFVTRDRGGTWAPCQGLPQDSRVIADRVNPQKFYALDLFGGKLFVSTDAAATFAEQPLNLPGGLPQKQGWRGDWRGGQDRLYATPGKEGDLWLAAFDGLYRSADAGKTFVKLDGVQEIHGFGFGKGAAEAEYPALYLVGVVNGQRGIYRSDDTARTWVRINDDRHQWGLVLHVTGDPKQYGRVYVGTHGRGTVYGDPAGKMN
jgi:photosystem II stability/assembly factor-like uncharacterized protein